MVSIGRWKIFTTAVARIMATNGAGTTREMRGQTASTISVPMATSVVGRLIERRFSPYAVHFSMKSAGTAPIFSPRKSLSWLEKMITAMPEVNPVMTG